MLCHSGERGIALEIPQRKEPIFVDLRVRFLVLRNDKNENKNK